MPPFRITATGDETNGADWAGALVITSDRLAAGLGFDDAVALTRACGSIHKQ